MDAGARAAPASGALARGALLLLFGLLRRAAAPHTDGLGDGLAVMVHVADLNRVARLEIGDSVQRSEEHTSELQSHHELVCRLLLEKKEDPVLHGERAAAHVRPPAG